jgi:hypothetical protein
MGIIIEQVANGEAISAMLEVWRQVFEHEMGITLASDAAFSAGNISHLLARLELTGQAIGTLSVVDTSGDRLLQESYDLRFSEGALSARFMHLAVLPPFRGMNVPLMMALEAHRCIIAPGQYDYTWLLFDPERAPASFLTRYLGFTPRNGIYDSEYGRRCPLVRDERTPEAKRVIRQAELYLRQFGAFHAPSRAHAYEAVGA